MEATRLLEPTSAEEPNDQTQPAETELPATDSMTLPEASSIDMDAAATPENLEAFSSMPEETPAQNALIGQELQIPWLVALVVCIAVAALTAFLTGKIVKRSITRRRRRAAGSPESYAAPVLKGTMTSGITPGAKTVTGMAIGNAHNIGSRENQEDAFGISDVSDERKCREQGVLCVVADGMGGLCKGEEVSAAVVSAMRNRFQKMPAGGTPPQMLLSLTEQANEDVNMLTGGVGGQSGSTMLAVLVRYDQMWFASVGDSRICLCRGGSMIQLTREHTYAVELDADAGKGTITFEEAASDSQRHALTRYIGMGALDGIDFNMRPVRLLPGDCVLLMSDGVFNTLSDEEIVMTLHGSAPEAANALESAVLAKHAPHQDNFTAIILQFK